MKRIVIIILLLPALLFGATFPVNQQSDDCLGTVANTLSWAIISANGTPGLDTIVFNTTPGVGDLWTTQQSRIWNSESYWTIFLGGAGNLPPLIDQSGVYIMGDVNKNGTPDIIVLPGGGQTWCFEVLSSNNTIEGIVIGGYPQYGIYIHSLGADEAVQLNRIWTCYIGTEIEGTAARPNGEGIFMLTDGDTLANPVKKNYVGKQYFPGADNVENVISGNELNGIKMMFHCDSNEVGSNHIGVDRTGLDTLPNLEDGVCITYLSDYNIIGTDGYMIDGWRLDRNIISGNGDEPQNSGVGIYDGSMWNKVAQNFIGTDKYGKYAIPNFFAGVSLRPDLEYIPPMDNYVGSDCNASDIGEWNMISGNGEETGYGIYMRETFENLVDSNFIGIDTSGTFAIPNKTAGVKLDTSSMSNLIGFNSGFFMIGTPVPGKWNLISGNGMPWLGYGVILEVAFENIVSGNWIGLNLLGNDTIPNRGDGVYLNSSSGNVIGSNSDGASDLQEGNYIAGNYGNGIYSIKSSNQIAGNVIGRTPTGSPRGNQMHGVMLDTATVWTPVGGTVYNTIVYNALAGVAVIDSSSHNNLISRNRFGYNGGLAIDLEDDGVTPNDFVPGDPDTGANTLLNFPVIDSAYYYGFPGNDSVIAWVSGLPFARGDLEIYKVLSDPTGYGEGDSIYGRFSIIDTIQTVVLFGLLSNDTISGIVSDTVNNTSEFGRNYGIKPAGIEEEHLDFSVSEVSKLITGRFMLQYTIPQISKVELFIVDQLGRKVAVLEKDTKSPGSYNIVWDCNKYLTNGVYFYIFKTNDNTAKGKFVFIR